MDVITEADRSGQAGALADAYAGSTLAKVRDSPGKGPVLINTAWVSEFQWHVGRQLVGCSIESFSVHNSRTGEATSPSCDRGRLMSLKHNRLGPSTPTEVFLSLLLMLMSTAFMFMKGSTTLLSGMCCVCSAGEPVHPGCLPVSVCLLSSTQHPLQLPLPEV